jgi:retron-type reverse transcriptase
MKRHGNLFDKVVSKDNIKLAIYKAAKGKSNQLEVKNVLSRIDHVVNDINLQLISETYLQGPYKIFEKQCGSKKRIIYKSSFYPDRIVHHCLINVLEPIWMKQVIRTTYGSIPKRGIHDAVKKIKQDLSDVKGTTYCLKLDFTKFYQSINHDSMKLALRRKIKDKRLLRLLDDNIDSACGIALGSYTSQWLGNIMLDELDHYLKEVIRVKYYYRYCDDIVMLSDSKEKLWDYLNVVREYAKKYKLQIKTNYQVFPIDKRGLDFLGYRFFHGYTLVRKRIVKKFKKMIKDNNHNSHAVASYMGWFKYANTFRLTKKYYGTIRSQN